MWATAILKPLRRTRVQFPFGFGLSYTSFSLENAQVKACGDRVRVRLDARNTGSRPGREVAQVYARAPQGLLGKPQRTLCAFQKTKLLQPGESQRLTLVFPIQSLASFDDSGATGHKTPGCWRPAAMSFSWARTCALPSLPAAFPCRSCGWWRSCRRSAPPPPPLTAW